VNFVAAILYAFSSSVLAGLFMGLGRPLSPGAAWSCLIVGAVSGLAAGRSGSWKTAPETGSHGYAPRLGRWGWLSLVLFTLFALRSFLWLVYETGENLMVLSPNNLGDLSLHLCYIRQIANGTALWPPNPIYSGAHLAYPLGVDLFNSLLTITGANVFRSLIWVGLAGSALTATALWHWGRAFSVVGFLCNGGLLGFALLWGKPLTDFQAEAAWKSIPLALFVTQRGLLFAIPAGLLLLSSWRARWFQNSPQAWRLPPWGEVWLYCALPLFHPHTFLFLSFLLGTWFLFLPQARRQLLVLICSAVLPATFLMGWVTGWFRGPSLLGWQPGWLRENEGFLEFWFQNFGVLPLLVAFLFWRLRKEPRGSWQRLSSGPAVVLFLICCCVRFAPWAWDNTKLMLWSYLVILPPLHTHLLQLWPLKTRIAAYVALFFSGFVSLMGGLGATPNGHSIANRGTLDSVAHAVRELPPESLFAAAPLYNHPLLLLGRPLVMGYEGHVWSHGYDWIARKKQLERVLLGEAGWRDAAQNLGVRFVFWGEQENAIYPDSEEPWRKESLCIDRGGWGAIYDLQSPRPEPPPSNTP
jgi:hypothetical protein